MRLIANLAEGFLMARRASQLRTNLWICMTDPPLLSLWVASYARRTAVPWVYWAMDLYPEAFAAAGLVSKRNFLYQWMAARVARNSPNYLITLGEAQRRFVVDTYNWRTPATCLPCGVVSQQASDVAEPVWLDKGRIVFGYVGNLGEAHSADFVYEVIQALDPQRHQFVLSVYGSKAELLVSRVRDLPVIRVVDAVPVQQLRYVDVHLASLMPDWDDVCVPSKAITAVCQGGALLFHGSPTNDIWRLLAECGWRIDPSTDVGAQVKLWLTNLKRVDVASKKAMSVEIAEKLRLQKQTSFEQILGFVHSGGV